VKKKSSVFIIIVSIAMLVLSATTLVFAWFTIVEKTTNIIVYSGTIETEYELRDLDTDTVITNQITYERILPGAVHNYRLTVTNNGTIDANLKVEFNFLGSNNIKSAFTINNDNNSYDFTQSRIVVENLVLYAIHNPNSSTYVYDFSVIFDSDYEDQTFDQVVTIENIVITLEQVI